MHRRTNITTTYDDFFDNLIAGLFTWRKYALRALTTYNITEAWWNA